MREMSKLRTALEVAEKLKKGPKQAAMQCYVVFVTVN